MNALLKAEARIDALTLADLDNTCAIENRAFERPWSRGNLVDSLAGDHLGLACRVHNQLVGYAIVMVVLDEMHLLNLVIDPDWQKRRLGQLLLEAVMTLARQRGCVSLYLEVRRSNVPAQKLYGANEFDVIGVRQQYYPTHQGREDAIVMRRSL
jgi:ribosomal-protein-alanine N-acetyltransferase